jgi:DNA repair ATPase RecN
MQEEERGAEPIERETQEPRISEPQVPVEEPAVGSEQDQIKKDGGPRRLRRFLLWTVGLLVLFALGVVAAWFLQIQPMREQNRTLRSDLTDAQQQVESLSSEVDRLKPFEAESEALKEQVAQLESHIFLLDVLVDVSKAQLGLVEEDAIAAKDALQGTGDHLKQLEERLSGPDAEAVRGMSERLALALEEVESDEFAARRDLEILANNLIALEQRLFGE